MQQRQLSPTRLRRRIVALSVIATYEAPTLSESLQYVRKAWKHAISFGEGEYWEWLVDRYGQSENT